MVTPFNARWLAILDAGLNPMLVKDIYQSFRNKGFIISYFGALFICLNAYLLVPIGTHYAENTGMMLLGWLIFCIAVIVLYTIPFGSGRQLREEIDSHALDLIVITHLTPLSILTGRFQAAMLKIVLLCAYFGPFISTAFLYGGVGALESLLILWNLVLLSALITALTLALNAVTAIIGQQVVNRVLIPALFISLLFIVPALSTVIWAVFDQNIISGELLNPLLWGMSTLFIFLLCGFILSLGTQWLTPLGLREARYPKQWLLAISLIHALSFTCMAYQYEGIGLDSSWQTLLWVGTVVGLVIAWWVCAFWMGQVPHQPVHLRRQLKAKPYWQRWVYIYLNDGYYYTFIYYLSISGLLLVPLIAWPDAASPLSSPWRIVALWGVSSIYLLYATGLACFINSFRKHPSTPSYILIFIIMCSMMVFIASVLQSSAILRPQSLWLIWFPLTEEPIKDYPVHALWLPPFIGMLCAYWGFKRIVHKKINKNINKC